MKSANNRKFIATLFSVALHGLVMSLFLTRYIEPRMTQSHSEGEKQRISIQLFIAHVPVVQEAEQKATSTPVAAQVINDRALIQTPPAQKAPVKAVKKSLTPRKSRESEKKQSRVEHEQKASPAPARTAPAPVNAVEGARRASALAGSSQGAAASKSSYISQLRAEIESHKAYPANARHAEGISIVAFRLTDDGALYDVQLRKSSGYSVLDRAAIEAVKHSRMTTSPPVDVPRSMTVSISFQLH